MDLVESVRQRPGMYFFKGTAGIVNLVLEVVANGVDLVLAGTATRLSVDVGDDGAITVRDDGPGLPVHATIDGRPLVEEVFTVLHSAPTADGHYPHVHLSLGFGLAPVTAACRSVEVEARCPDGVYRATFAPGVVTSALARVAPAPAATGTAIRLRPDAAVFGDGEVDRAMLRDRLRALAWIHPGLVTELDGERFGRRGSHRAVRRGAWRRCAAAPRAVPRQLPHRFVLRPRSPGLAAGTGLAARTGVLQLPRDDRGRHPPARARGRPPPGPRPVAHQRPPWRGSWPPSMWSCSTPTSAAPRGGGSTARMPSSWWLLRSPRRCPPICGRTSTCRSTSALAVGGPIGEVRGADPSAAPVALGLRAAEQGKWNSLPIPRVESSGHLICRPLRAARGRASRPDRATVQRLERARNVR